MGKTTKVTHGQTFTTRRAVVVETFIFLTSVFFTFGAYFTLLYLQSSINIEKGLGKYYRKRFNEYVLFLGCFWI